MTIDQLPLNLLGLFRRAYVCGALRVDEGNDFTREVAAFVDEAAPEDARLPPTLVRLVEAKHDEDTDDGGQ